MMKIFIISFSSICIFNLNLNADTIKLKDGKIIEGRILSENESEVMIKTITGIQEISKRKIVNIKLGYSSIGACYRLTKDIDTKDCTKRLYQITPDRIKLVLKNVSDPPEYFLLSDLYELEINKGEGEDIIPFLKLDTVFEFILKSKSIKGRLISKTDTFVRVLTDAASIVEIEEKEISVVFLRNKLPRKERSLASTRIDPTRNGTPAKLYHYLLPGSGQYERGEMKKSAFYFSSTFLLVAGIWSQYNEAKSSMTKHDYLLIPNEYGFYVLNDSTKSKNQFDVHQRNYYLLASGLIFTLILNAFDIRSHQSENQKLGFDFYVAPDIGNRMAGAVQFQYSLRF